MTKSNPKKLSALNAKLEAKTDYYGEKLLAWPYSWVLVAVLLVLAGFGTVGIIGWFVT